MIFPHGETVTRIRRKLTVDPYSAQETLGSWADVEETAIPGVGIAPGASSELPGVAMDRLDTHATLYCPTGVRILPTDRIRTPDGQEWDVDGHPAQWKQPMTGWMPGVVIVLKRREP